MVFVYEYARVREEEEVYEYADGMELLIYPYDFQAFEPALESSSVSSFQCDMNGPKLCSTFIIFFSPFSVKSKGRNCDQIIDFKLSMWTDKGNNSPPFRSDKLSA